MTDEADKAGKREMKWSRILIIIGLLAIFAFYFLLALINITIPNLR